MKTPIGSVHTRHALAGYALAVLVAATLFATPGAAAAEAGSDAAWTPLFNGKDLDGWTPQVRRARVWARTMPTRSGSRTVCSRPAYDKYEKFDGQFGHLFYKTPYSHYRLRVEYRFVGEQAAGGPAWAFRNNGPHAALPRSPPACGSIRTSP